MTEANIENILQPLKRVSYIYYLLCFWKDLHKTKTLFDLGSEVNAITLAYAAKLGLKVQKTNISAKKIDGFIFNTFKMVWTDF